MGCGTSTDQQDIPALLLELRKKIEQDPSAITDADRRTLEHIAKQTGARYEAKSAPSIVRQSWERMVDVVGANTIGERIVHELVRIQPVAEVVFFGVSIPRQGDAIRRMLDQVVRVEQESATLVPLLLTLGARHVLYGVEADLLLDMKQAATTVFAQVHNGAMLAEEVAAWNAVWTTVIELMQHGMKSPAGEANRQKCQANANRVVQAVWQKILLKQLEGPEELRLFTRVMYKTIISHRPDFVRFTNLTDFRTADRVMNMLTMLVDNRVAGRDSSAMLRESGVRHIAYDVSVDDLRAFEQPFLDTCKIYLEDELNLRTSYELLRFWRWVVDGLAVGMTGDIDREAMHAPQSSELAIAFTDVEKSTKLWETNPAVMGVALEKHNRIIRQLIQQFNGYEVKTIGDSFMVAFRSATDVILFACAVQTEFMLQAPTANGFKMVTPTQGGGPVDQWDDTTMRVRVGIEWCNQVNAQYDTVHRRFDYFGPSVNIAARVESCAGGGQVLATAACIRQLELEERGRVSPAIAPFEFISLAPASTPNSPRTAANLSSAVCISLFKKAAQLKGVQDPVDLYDIAPQSLSRREFSSRNIE
jgi:class 3 adenylate cyclase